MLPRQNQHSVLSTLPYHQLLIPKSSASTLTLRDLQQNRQLLNTTSPITSSPVVLLALLDPVDFHQFASKLPRTNSSTCWTRASFDLPVVLGLHHFIWFPNLNLVIGVHAVTIVVLIVSPYPTNIQFLISKISLHPSTVKPSSRKSTSSALTTKSPWLRTTFARLLSPPHLVCLNSPKCHLVSATQLKPFNALWTKLLVVSILFMCTSMTFSLLAQTPSNTKSIYDYFSTVSDNMVSSSTRLNAFLVFRLSSSLGIKLVHTVSNPATRKFKPFVISLSPLPSPNSANSLAL